MLKLLENAERGKPTESAEAGGNSESTDTCENAGAEGSKSAEDATWGKGLWTSPCRRRALNSDYLHFEC